MTDGLFNGGSMPALESLVHFAAARHRVIALNVANVSTAGYRAQDLSVAGFRAAMERALAGEGRVAPEALAAGPAGDAGPLKSDGNNVDIEVEMARMVRNQGLHAFATALLAQQFTMLREAVSERVLA